MNTLNLHGLLYASAHESYEDNISLSESDRTSLLEARAAIRAHIRLQLGNRLKTAQVENASKIAPKFITQGSFAYKTINAPDRPPEQQADLDDGVYVPLSFCENTGAPKAASKALIGAIEVTLQDLSVRRRWTVDTGNPNCTRVLIAGDKHVDVPIYSMPDEEYRVLAKSTHELAKSAGSFADFYDSSALDDNWDVMPRRVRLAHKTLGWIDSDPRPIKEWVELQVSLKSEQLRRLMRYLKGWRDHQRWPFGEPKSLLLMALANATLERKIDGRDDLALVQVCSGIPDALRGKVEIPAAPGEDLAERLDADGLRDELIRRIRDLHRALVTCVQGRCTPEEACRLMREHFGRRFPNRPDRIRIESPEQTVRAVAPRIISAAPVVGRKQAG